MKPPYLNIILIDDQPIYREGIKQVLESSSQYNVLVSSDDYFVAESILSYRVVDLMLIGITVLMQQKEKIAEHIAKYKDTKVIILATENERFYVTDAIEIGAHGFLLREMDVSSFQRAIKLIYNGILYIHPMATEKLVDAFCNLLNGNVGHTKKDAQCPLHLYTKRECEVLQLLAEGKSNRTIAKELNISEKTVKNHISNLFRKMNVNDRTHAVVLAIRNKWVAI